MKTFEPAVDALRALYRETRDNIVSIGHGMDSDDCYYLELTDKVGALTTELMKLQQAHETRRQKTT